MIRPVCITISYSWKEVASCEGLYRYWEGIYRLYDVKLGGVGAASVASAALQRGLDGEN